MLMVDWQHESYDESDFVSGGRGKEWRRNFSAGCLKNAATWKTEKESKTKVEVTTYVRF
jgi:hypothetical protein